MDIRSIIKDELERILHVDQFKGKVKATPTIPVQIFIEDVLPTSVKEYLIIDPTNLYSPKYLINILILFLNLRKNNPANANYRLKLDHGASTLLIATFQVEPDFERNGTKFNFYDAITIENIASDYHISKITFNKNVSLELTLL